MKLCCRILCLLLTAALTLSALGGSALARTRGSVGDDELVRAVVLLRGDPAAGTAPAKRGSVRQRLTAQHARLRSDLEARGVDLTLDYDYTSLLNGMAVTVPRGALPRIAAMDGVISVHEAIRYDPPEEVRMDSSNQMTGAAGIHLQGWTGSGTVIAVIDTGISPGHEAFAVYDGMLQQAAISEAAARDGITALGYGRYLSRKIPFAYDYADRDDDVRDDSSGHGSHVAGIAAGCARDKDGNIVFSGTAPDAQILAMKVFSSHSEGTDSAVYFKALEDAFVLGADVINMSLGSQNGFSSDKELEDAIFGNIYQLLEDNGVALVAAAGNESSMASGASNAAGSGMVTADYADYGVVAAPSTYPGNLSVASAENVSYSAHVVRAGGQDLPIYEADGEIFSGAMAGKTCEYLVIPGLGAAEDYVGLDCSGRIALVSRGELTFQEKIDHAAAAGAAACLIYNNEGGVIYMTVDDYRIPAAFLSQADGAYLLSLAQGGVGTLTVPSAEELIESREGWQISGFSSWGTTAELTGKPAVTGVGGNVSSVDHRTTDGYTLMSGTSMASPNVAGAVAVMLGFVRQTYPAVPHNEQAAVAEALLCSTARLLTRDSVLYSPRQQGAGLIDLAAAAKAKSCITEPVLSAGDSTDGSFDLSFSVRNLTGKALCYEFSLDALADEIQALDTDEDGEEDDLYNLLRSVPLEDCVLSGPSRVTVPAGGTARVTLTVTAAPEVLDRYARLCPNGGFLEGFLHLTETALPQVCDGSDGCPSGVFTDVAGPEDWSHAGIDFAVANGLFNGTSSDTFSPEAAMTRAMMVTVLYRLAGRPDAPASNPFSDVPSGEYYTRPVSWAAANGIVNGTSADTFSPDENITREQMAAILFRYAGFAGYDVSARASFDGFPDAAQVSDYAAEPLRWAVANGIINGNVIDGRTLADPAGNATRDQVATMFMRFAGRFAPAAEEGPHDDAIHAAFVGFCGDWTRAPIMEPRDWRDVAGLPAADPEAYRDALADLGVNTDVTGGYTVHGDTLYDTEEGFDGFYAGDNPFGAAPYSDAHIAISPTGWYDTVYVEPMLLRNARHLIMTAVDAQTGALYYVDDTEYLPKAFWEKNGLYWQSSGFFVYDGTDADGNVLPSGTRVDVDFYANLPWGEDALGAVAYDALRTDGGAWRVMHFTVTVDSSAPKLEPPVYDAANRTLTVTVQDDVWLASVQLRTPGEQEDTVAASLVYADEVPGQSHTAVFSDLAPGSYVLSAGDYAANVTELPITLGSDPLEFCTVSFVCPGGLTLQGGRDVNVLASRGDAITLPTLNADEFLGWVTEPVPRTLTYDEVVAQGIDEKLLAPGDSFTVERSLTLYPLFEFASAVSDPEELLKEYWQEPADYNGVWAFGGFDWKNYAGDDFFSCDGSTVRQNTLQDEDLITYLPDAPGSVLFRLTGTAEGLYTIRSEQTGTYLAVRGGALTFLDAPDDTAAWELWYDADAESTFVLNGDGRTVLAYDLRTAKFGPVSLDAIDTDAQWLVLYGPVPTDYVYTTTWPT